MKFYHYVKKGNTVLQQGLFGFAGSPNGDLEKIYINPPLSLNEAISQKQLQDIQDKHNDGFYPIALNQIPTDPVDWTVCDDAAGRRFAFVPFYFLIMKKGVISPSYLKKI